MPIVSGLSGNEIYCLAQKGYTPGDIVIGNSVYSLGVMRSFTSGIKSVIGGELTACTKLVEEGRQAAYLRMVHEAQAKGGIGITGVTSELVIHDTNVEFIAVGSVIHNTNIQQEKISFSTAADGQELYTQIDAGYQPLCFAFGNVAYAMGAVQGFLGGLKTIKRGEIREFSDIFSKTRNAALNRIVEHAKTYKANAVVGIKTSILPFQNIKEMVMIGTAAHNPMLSDKEVVTSDLTHQEMWSLTKLGYAPVRLLMGTSVYSLGMIGSITSVLKSYMRGEITELTQMLYGARENALAIIKQEAQEIGAEEVVGVKTYIHNLGNNLIEFLAIGTAIKKVSGLATASEQLPPQAFIIDKNTFFDTSHLSIGVNLNEA